MDRQHRRRISDFKFQISDLGFAVVGIMWRMGGGSGIMRAFGEPSGWLDACHHRLG
jgi:hypothetical protein